MTESDIYRDIAVRTNGAFMLGVVGPVRTGKSTFIKRFMETMVIPQIENTYMRERAKDELPQSGSGRTIMTAEPKFVPEESVTVQLSDSVSLSVRLVDCVGYMVDGAAGQFEEGSERLVTTPWFDYEVPLSEAAEKGTHKVITEHSTIGIVITTDGSICDISRESYLNAERRVIQELSDIGKPFVVLLNSTEPQSQRVKQLAAQISGEYGVRCIPVNCLEMEKQQFAEIIQYVLEEFPLKSVGVYIPEWLEALDEGNSLKQSIYRGIIESVSQSEKIRDCEGAIAMLGDCENISSAQMKSSDLGTGNVCITLQLPRDLYYRTISEETGIEVKNDGDLIATLCSMSAVKHDYDSLREALDSVRSCGYGVVMPDSSQMTLQEPQIVRQGGKYSVRLKANAPAIHMLMTNIETEVTPAIGGESASEDIINFLLQGFDGDVNRIWESNIFGKSLNDIAEEGLTTKIASLPESAKRKLTNTLQRIINEGSSGLICIIL